MVWQLGPSRPQLDTNEVHLWRASQPSSNEILSKLKDTLSEDELTRLNRFVFDKDKRNYILSRGGIKNILARYLNIAPKEIQISYGDFGKPYLKELNLQFNLSHSGNHILYAIANRVPVGIDVESIKFGVDFLALATEFCCDRELMKLSDLAQAELKLAFYRCWTRKEAFIKAIGLGFYFPVKDFEVSFLPTEKTKLLKFNENLMTSIKENIGTKIISENKFLMDTLKIDPWKVEMWKLEEIFANEKSVATIAMPLVAQKTAHWDWEFV